MLPYKIYNLMLSRVFPATHSRAGESTEFAIKMLNASFHTSNVLTKLHTIRGNYDLWAKRIEEIEHGNALLRVRMWEGLPYRSKTKVIKQLSWEDGVGVQRLELNDIEHSFEQPIIDGVKCTRVELYRIAMNDGLTFSDWREWMSKYDISQPLAIIHFTPFRYVPIVVNNR